MVLGKRERSLFLDGDLVEDSVQNRFDGLIRDRAGLECASTGCFKTRRGITLTQA